MKRVLRCLLLSGLSLCASVALQGGETVQLFNGSDLDGWVLQTPKVPESAWRAEGNTLVGENYWGAWLRTSGVYTDFELRFEFRLSPGANSGVSLRAPAKGDPSHDGIEIQLLDDSFTLYRNIAATQKTGAIYKQVPPRARAARPVGEWNACVIHCRGAELVVALNGMEVNRVNLDAHKSAADARTPLSERPRSGHIALEARAGAVQFRNLVVKPF